MLVIAAAFLVACDKEESKCGPLSLSTQSIIVDSENDSDMSILHVYSDVPWTISSSEDWCRVFPSSGNRTTTSGMEVMVFCNENKGSERTAALSVSDGSATLPVMVVQKKKKGLLVSEKCIGFSNDASSKDITYDADSDVTFTSDGQSWLECWRVKKGVLRISVKKNGSSRIRRSGTVTISDQEGASVEIRVFQGDGCPDSELYNMILMPRDHNYNGILDPEELADVTELDLYLSGVELVDGLGIFPNLTTLKLLSSNDVTINLEDLPSLKDAEIYVRSAGKISVSNCVGLTRLDIDEVDDCHISNCPELRELTIPSIDSFTGLSSLKKLENLKTSGTISSFTLDGLPEIRKLNYTDQLNRLWFCDLSLCKNLEHISIIYKDSRDLYSSYKEPENLHYLILNSSLEGRSDVYLNLTEDRCPNLSIIYK